MNKVTIPGVPCVRMNLCIVIKWLCLSSFAPLHHCVSGAQSRRLTNGWALSTHLMFVDTQASLSSLSVSNRCHMLCVDHKHWQPQWHFLLGQTPLDHHKCHLLQTVREKKEI